MWPLRFRPENAAKSCPKCGKTDAPLRINATASAPKPAASTFLEPIAEATLAGIGRVPIGIAVLLAGFVASFLLGVDPAILAATAGIVLILAMLLFILKSWSDGGMDG